MSAPDDDLRALEETLLDPDVRRNRAALQKLLTEDFVEFGSSGRAWTRDEIIDLLQNEIFSPPRIEDFQCVLLAENIALVTYRAMRSEIAGGATIYSLRSSIWMKIAGEWRCRFHQGTRSS